MLRVDISRPLSQTKGNLILRATESLHHGHPLQLRIARSWTMEKSATILTRDTKIRPLPTPKLMESGRRIEGKIRFKQVVVKVVRAIWLWFVSGDGKGEVFRPRADDAGMRNSLPCTFEGGRQQEWLRLHWSKQEPKKLPSHVHLNRFGFTKISQNSDPNRWFWAVSSWTTCNCSSSDRERLR